MLSTSRSKLFRRQRHSARMRPKQQQQRRSSAVANSSDSKLTLTTCRWHHLPSGRREARPAPPHARSRLRVEVDVCTPRRRQPPAVAVKLYIHVRYTESRPRRPRQSRA